MATHLPKLPATTAAEVRASLHAKSKPGPGGCRLWTGALSQSGWRAVWYPAVWAVGRTWRVNRLVLLLDDLDPGTPFAEALARAARARKGDEAAHACDTAGCISRAHLDWKSHRANVVEQAERRAAARLEPDEDLEAAREVADQLRAERLARQGAWA